VLSEVLVVIGVCLKGEDEGICVVRVSREGVDPAYYPEAK